MADNVPITAGTGTSIATDDVGGVHYQRIKLVTGEADTAERIGDNDEGTARALWVAGAPADVDSSAAYEASAIIKASAGRLYKLFGYNSGAAQFVQLHNSATVPADTAVPVLVIDVTANKAFEIDFGLRGMEFSAGIVVCNSSTAPTKTIGSADCFFTGIYK